MPEVKVRKFLVSVEEIHHEGGPPAAVPPKRGVILAVVEKHELTDKAAMLQEFLGV